MFQNEINLKKDSNLDESFISGVVERITFRNTDNGFSVLQIKIKGRKDKITVVGNVGAISVGENIEAVGVWHNDSRYGLQLKADVINIILPTTIDGIKKYLGSGLIRGIGPHFASKIVDKFGTETIPIIETKSELLKSIAGLGEARIELIVKSWNENKVIRDIMIFLQGHNVSSAMAVKIFRYYGSDSIDLVKENPYRLAKDVKGIGFLSADKIAINLGLPMDSPQRAQAAISYILNEAAGNGHCCLPKTVLLEKANRNLNIALDLLDSALKKEIQEKNIISIEIENDEIEKIENDMLLYSPSFFHYEKYIADRLCELNSFQSNITNKIDSDKALNWLGENYKIRLSDSQKEALKLILNNKVSVITGGPGTGKTTLINSLIKILTEHVGIENKKIKLAAPTGRAAKRLSESTRKYASTIHRLLEFDPQTAGFKYNSHNRLPCDLLILDETSMIDTQLMFLVLKSLNDGANLILVGDIDQIPSVGAGQVLSDIINSNTLAVAKLNKIFRQAANSAIVTNAHLVNKGYMPKLSDINREDDFWFCEIESPELAISRINAMLQYDLPKFFSENKKLFNKRKLNKENDDEFNNLNLNIKKDVQILSPMQKGNVGVKSLNIELQKILNSEYHENFIEKYGQKYAVGDKVIQIENNYEKIVFNGDIGFIEFIDKEKQILIINFDNREIEYDFEDLDQINLAYAITIHKSQGSEYPVVIIPMMTQHFVMLNKNLLYTAITRAKNLAILVGQRKAIGMAVSNTSSSKRYTKLKDWLQEKNK